MFDKILLALALILGGLCIRQGGGAINQFVEVCNDGYMPVWCLTQTMSNLVDLNDGTHDRLTLKSNYIILSDIIPVPYTVLHYTSYAMYSVGDIVLDMGEVAYGIGLIWLIWLLIIESPYQLIKMFRRFI